MLVIRYICIFIKNSRMEMKRLLWFVVVCGVLSVVAQGGESKDRSVAALRKFVEAEQKVKGMYVDTVDEEKVVEHAIEGMLEKLDPHSVYIPKDEVQRMTEPLEGEFEGVGVTFTMVEDTLHVENTIEGGPSEKVGIRAGDRITHVNDTLIAGVKKKTTDIMKMLRGKKGTKVKVKVARRGEKEPLEFVITRDKIPLKSVTASYMLTDRIGYLRLSKFSESSKKEWDEAVKGLRKEGMKDLVVDLRANGGGYLQVAAGIADEMLTGRKAIVSTKGRVLNTTYNSNGIGSLSKVRIVFLVDEYSASASEILSGAMQDWDRAVVVGRRTFGKGLVQQQLKLEDGSMIRLTVARYYTPSGRCIQKPYQNGLDAYKHDALDRLKNGELTNADSIKLPDSLKFYTKRLGRAVYGGGGIVPDFFVPLDTTKNSRLLVRMVSKGVLNAYATKVAEDGKTDWKARYKTIERFSKEMVPDEEMLSGLELAAKSEQVEWDDKEWARVKTYAGALLKSLIARSVWGEEGYYRVVNDDDAACKKAIDVLEGGDYERLLGNK